MEMMGWVHEAIKIDELVYIVSKELANIIAIANEHSYWDALDKKEIGDGYYTPEEINKVMAGFVENPQETRFQSRSCHCVAH